jgi:hypothetical protein
LLRGSFAAGQDGTGGGGGEFVRGLISRNETENGSKNNQRRPWKVTRDGAALRLHWHAAYDLHEKAQRVKSAQFTPWSRTPTRLLQI